MPGLLQGFSLFPLCFSSYTPRRLGTISNWFIFNPWCVTYVLLLVPLSTQIFVLFSLPPGSNPSYVKQIYVSLGACPTAVGCLQSRRCDKQETRSKWCGKELTMSAEKRVWMSCALQKHFHYKFYIYCQRSLHTFPYPHPPGIVNLVKSFFSQKLFNVHQSFFSYH